MKTVESRLIAVMASATLAALVASAFPGAPAIAAPPRAVTSKTAAPQNAVPASQPVSQGAQISQVLNRLGFGPRPGDVQAVRALGISRYIESQLNPAGIDDRAVESKLAGLPSLGYTPALLANAYQSDQARQRMNREKKQEKAKTAAATPVKNDTVLQKEGDEKMEGVVADKEPARPVFALAKSNPVKEQRDEAVLAEAERNGFGPRITLQIVGEMQTAKLVRAVESKRQLQEVLVDFWTNHFNLDVKKGPVATLRLADERDVIRPNVLGKFRDMLGASAKSPAMLVYLDNVRSSRAAPPTNLRNRRKNAPAVNRKARGGVNENYAREIMELHTLGVNGGYTQTDVQEVARCFTGWSQNPSTGEFMFRRNAHDDDSKVVLGHAIPAGGGIRDGEMVLDILAAHPATAHHLAYQLCQRFIADTPPAGLVDRGAQAYLQSGGDLKALTQTIVTSPEFLAASNLGVKIKSPFEFVVSAVRAMDGTVNIPNISRPRERLQLISNGGVSANRNAKLGNIQSRTLPRELAEMGQPMFSCLPPTGYPEDSSSWVSAGALVNRLNFAIALSNGTFADVQTPMVSSQISDKDAANRVRSQAQQLLGKDLSPATQATIQKQVEADPALDQRKLSALILGSPEFQRR